MELGKTSSVVKAPVANAENTDFLFPNQDRKSIYYVHSSDALGSCLVSNKLQKETNFYTQQYAMKVTLVSRQKLGFAIGDILKLETNSRERDAWETCNGLVLSCLFNVVKLDSAVVAWTSLEDRYKISNKPQIFKMKQDISVMCHGEDSVCVYFQKLMCLWGLFL